jgi:hypothetical protein
LQFQEGSTEEVDAYDVLNSTLDKDLSIEEGSIYPSLQSSFILYRELSNINSGFSKVVLEVVQVERAIGTASVVTVECFPDGFVNSVVISHVHMLSWARLKLKFLVVEEVADIFDLKTISIAHLTFVPGSTDVSLALRRIFTAPARTTCVVKLSTDLASRTDGRVRLTSRSYMEVWFVTTDRVAFNPAAIFLSDVLDAVMRDHSKV